MCLVLKVLNELKQTELGNSEKEEKMQVKKKTIDLLPDADNNLLKLQVGGLSDISDNTVDMLSNLDLVKLVCSFSRLRWRPAPSGW